MMQNKDEEIIKALEYCTSPKVTEECPRQPKGVTCNDGCEFLLMKDALDLINRQQAEIERLRTMNSELNIGIKKLKEFAAKEFAERLNKHSVYVDDYDCFMVSAESIDNLVKEMTEPVKIEHNSLCETETYMG